MDFEFTEPSSLSQNNVYNAPAGTGGFEVTHAGAVYQNGITQSNNLSVSSTNNVWYAADGFSCANQGANGWWYPIESEQLDVDESFSVYVYGGSRRGVGHRGDRCGFQWARFSRSCLPRPPRRGSLGRGRHRSLAASASGAEF